MNYTFLTEDECVKLWNLGKYLSGYPDVGGTFPDTNQVTIRYNQRGGSANIELKIEFNRANQIQIQSDGVMVYVSLPTSQWPAEVKWELSRSGNKFAEPGQLSSDGQHRLPCEVSILARLMVQKTREYIIFAEAEKQRQEEEKQKRIIEAQETAISAICNIVQKRIVAKNEPDCSATNDIF